MSIFLNCDLFFRWSVSHALKILKTRVFDPPRETLRLFTPPKMKKFDPRKSWPETHRKIIGIAMTRFFTQKVIFAAVWDLFFPFIFPLFFFFFFPFFLFIKFFFDFFSNLGPKRPKKSLFGSKIGSKRCLPGFYAFWGNFAGGRFFSLLGGLKVYFIRVWGRKRVFLDFQNM